MTLFTRRIIYLSFILVFFIITPIILLYTIGYRWNFYKNQFDKIGALVIKTKPELVNIQINDQTIGKKTPWRDNNLLPNVYQITVSKPGYQDWQKQLTIKSGETTFAEHIYLFLEPQTPTAILKQDIKNWTYNASAEYFLIQDAEGLKLYNFLNDRIELIAPLQYKIEDFSWSSDKQNLLLKTSDNLIFWRLAEPTKLIYLDDNLKTPLLACRWLENNNDTLNCNDGRKIWQYSILSGVKNIVIDSTGQIIDFYQAGNNLYYLEKDLSDQNVYLKILNQLPNQSQSPDYLLPVSTGYQFINVRKNLATILDKNNSKLYLLNLYDEEDIFNKTSQIISDVKDAFYLPNDTLVYYNDWELWINKNQHTSLITRQSNKISEVLSYPSLNHLIILAQDGIKIIELDDRDKRNSAQIVNLDYINKASLNKEANEIFFSLNQPNGLNGLFKIEILANAAGEPEPTKTP